MSVLNDPLLISLHPTHQPRTLPKAGAFRRRRILVAALSLFVVASGAFAQSAMANKPGLGYQGVPRTVVAAPETHSGTSHDASRQQAIFHPSLIN